MCMTIAACYLSPEGVVFGADSTTGLGNRYFNYAQKIFEIEESPSTLGLVVWGLGGLGDLSYRTLVRRFAEHNYYQATADVQDIANGFGQFFWQEYMTRMGQHILRFHQLGALAKLTDEQQKERENLARDLSGGFCLGGNLGHDPTPQAFVISYNPGMSAAVVQPLPMHLPMFWGQPNLIQRLASGIDE